MNNELARIDCEALPSKIEDLKRLLKQGSDLKERLRLPIPWDTYSKYDFSNYADEDIDEMRSNFQAILLEVHEIVSRIVLDELIALPEGKQYEEQFYTYGVVGKYELQRFDRGLAYRDAKMPCFELPPVVQSLSYTGCYCLHERQVVAERILYLQRMIREGRNPYENEDRYFFDRFTAKEELLEQLDPIHHWLLTNDALPTLEWDYFSYVVGLLTCKSITFDEAGQNLLDFLQQDGVSMPKTSIKDFTETPTPKELRDVDSECAVCFSEFDSKNQAVKTPCGHIFGSDCLGKWAQKKNTCPICRAPLRSVIDRLPARLQPLYERAVDIIEAVKSLDMKVDRYLLTGMKEVNGPEFGELISSLAYLNASLCDAIKTIDIERKMMRPLGSKIEDFVSRRIVWLSARVPSSWNLVQRLHN